MLARKLTGARLPPRREAMANRGAERGGGRRLAASARLSFSPGLLIR
jgi:hypothetical protein